jgi:diguanylate cyclase
LTASEEIIARQWAALLSSASPSAKTLLERVARQQIATLSGYFYDVLLQDPQASAILSSEEIEVRLNASLQRWLIDILCWDLPDVAPLVLQQRHIGLMHSRVNVTIELVLRGARVIKNALLAALLAEPDAGPEQSEAARLAVSLIDIAMEAMSAAFAVSREKAARTDQAFRNYAATVNATLEREKQRAALFDWSNRLFQELMTGGNDLQRIGQSPFGYWVRHKAPALFTEQAELSDLVNGMERIDRALLPACIQNLEHSPLELRRVTKDVVSEVDQIRTLTESLFDYLVHIDAGRDSQTQLLNRRFLSPVLSREIELSRSSGNVFSVLMLDVDHFKSINDRFGHDAGDRVLERVAQLVAVNARSGDFAFRYGGEEFLVVCVEQDSQQAIETAEALRKAIEQEIVEIPGHGRISVTASIGIAVHDGHPDYQRLINRADAALYAAKGLGRNRCQFGE